MGKVEGVIAAEICQSVTLVNNEMGTLSPERRQLVCCECERWIKGDFGWLSRLQRVVCGLRITFKLNGNILFKTWLFIDVLALDSWRKWKGIIVSQNVKSLPRPSWSFCATSSNIHWRGRQPINGQLFKNLTNGSRDFHYGAGTRWRQAFHVNQVVCNKVLLVQRFYVERWFHGCYQESQRSTELCWLLRHLSFTFYFLWLKVLIVLKQQYDTIIQHIWHNRPL